MTKEQKNNMSTEEITANIKLPDVLMLMGTQCAFCGPMMQVLTEFMKAGYIAELKIVNIETNEKLAQELGVRSVPWLRLGPFELKGSRTRQELLKWMRRASSFEGINEYLEELLLEGNIEYVGRLLKRYPPALNNVIELMAEPDAKINVRLGVGVVIEDIAETEEFKSVVPRFIEYLSHQDARIRGDACHYLSLTKDESCIPVIESLLSDKSEEVREIAQDSLDELHSTG